MPRPPFKVLLFASLKERARTDTIEVAAHGVATVGDLIARVCALMPNLAGPLAGCRIAVDQEFVSSEHPLTGGEEIAAIPPVSGGHDGRPEGAVQLLSTPLSLATVTACVDHPGAGGIATFTGNVRRDSRGQTIEYLDYEAYAPMATKTMRAIVEQIERDIHGARVAIHHRVGRLMVGETAVVIAASAPHRAEAFAACRAAIEALKESVPIWKKEVSTTGESWIGRGP